MQKTDVMMYLEEMMEILMWNGVTNPDDLPDPDRYMFKVQLDLLLSYISESDKYVSI